MGLDATNKVLLRFKSACSATVTSWKIKISLEANSDMMLSKRRITKVQIGPRFMLTPLHGMFLFRWPLNPEIEE